MSDILFWNEARKELNEDKLLNKCDTFVDSLMANGLVYPHIFDMNMDNVAGKTADSIRREMSRLYKLLTKKLKNVTPLTDEFQIHKGFLGKVKGANAEATYLPLVLLFDDGQILTGLAKRYDDGGYKVVKWFLNDEDVTKAIYGNKTRDIVADKNYNELAKRLAIIVNYNHKKFIRKKNNNPIQKEIQELEKKKEELIKRRDKLKKQIELLNNKKEQGEPIQEEVKEEPQVSEEPLLDTKETEEAINEELENEKQDQENNTPQDEPINEPQQDDEIEFGENILDLKPWEKGNIKRLYLKVKGISNYQHRNGSVYLQIKNGVWYSSKGDDNDDMKNLADQLNEKKLFDTKKIKKLFDKYIYNKTMGNKNEIEEKLKALLESDNPEYIDSQLDEIMENMSDEEFEKYEELMREVNNKIKQLISNKRG